MTHEQTAVFTLKGRESFFLPHTWIVRFFVVFMKGERACSPRHRCGCSPPCREVTEAGARGSWSQTRTEMKQSSERMLAVTLSFLHSPLAREWRHPQWADVPVQLIPPSHAQRPRLPDYPAFFHLTTNKSPNSGHTLHIFSILVVWLR